MIDLPEQKDIGTLATLNGGQSFSLVVADLGVVFHSDGLRYEGDGNLTYDQWELLGRGITYFGDAWQWWVGDWINWGERVFGDDAAAAVDGDIRDRYQQAHRVTNLPPQTLQNIASVCRRVAKGRRRTPPLGFWIHQDVAALEPDEQTEWLEEAIQAGMGRQQLRDAIKEARSGGDGGSSAEPWPGEERLSVRDRLQRAADLVIADAQPLPDGGYLVSEEAMAKLREASGHETTRGG